MWLGRATRRAPRRGGVLPLRLLHVNAALREAARPRQCGPPRVSQSMAVKESYRLSIFYVGYPAKRGPQRSRSAPCLLSLTQFWISDAKLDHRNRRFQLICPSFYCFFSLLRRCYKNEIAEGEKHTNRNPREGRIFCCRGRSYARKKTETVGVARKEAVLLALSARNIADPADRSRSGSQTGDPEQ